MKTIVAILLLVGVSDPDFERGDANNDAKVNASDASYISNYLYFGGPEPACLDAADANDDGQLDGQDSAFIFSYLFLGGPPPPFPGPELCLGPDPTQDSLDCQNTICKD